MSVVNRIADEQVHQLKMELTKQVASMLRTDKTKLIYHITEQIESTCGLIKTLILTEGGVE